LKNMPHRRAINALLWQAPQQVRLMTIGAS
jgi:hypothetical protein